jgi:hypothetical protein
VEEAKKEPEAKKSAEESPWALDPKLIGVCFVLWIAAAGIFYSSWDETKRNYYWGNIKQGLDERPQHIDGESMAALSAMGEAVVPSCEYELSHHWDPQFRCAVLRVLEPVAGEKARAVIESKLRGQTLDLDARVRANAILALKTRAAKWPEEKKSLVATCKEALGTSGDSDPTARSLAAIIVAEAGESTDAVKALLVFALRVPQLQKDAAAALKKVAADGPDFSPEGTGMEKLNQIMAYEKWCEDKGIALVASKLTIAPTSTATGVAPQGTR